MGKLAIRGSGRVKGPFPFVLSYLRRDKLPVRVGDNYPLLVNSPLAKMPQMLVFHWPCPALLLVCCKSAGDYCVTSYSSAHGVPALVFLSPLFHINDYWLHAADPTITFTERYSRVVTQCTQGETAGCK